MYSNALQRKSLASSKGKCREKLCLIAIQQEDGVLEDVLAGLRTPEICLAAVQQDGRALALVPQELKSLEICLTAIQQYGAALAFVPQELISEDLCHTATAIQQCGETFQMTTETQSI